MTNKESSYSSNHPDAKWSHSEVMQNIGMLRQWLNEERITEPSKMVTNEELSHWLSLRPPTV